MCEGRTGPGDGFPGVRGGLRAGGLSAVSGVEADRWTGPPGAGQTRGHGHGERPESGPAILASNHLSIIDSIFLPLMVPRPVTFAAKSEYFTGTGLRDKAIAAYLRATNQLSTDRAGPRAAQAMLDAALALLQSGELFGIYPEGTRSPDGRLYRGGSAPAGWP